MLGFVLSAVSPAVILPVLISLADKGYGVSKVSNNCLVYFLYIHEAKITRYGAVQQYIYRVYKV